MHSAGAVLRDVPVARRPVVCGAQTRALAASGISSTSFHFSFELVFNGETDVGLLEFYFSKENISKVPSNYHHHFPKERTLAPEKKQKTKNNN